MPAALAQKLIEQKSGSPGERDYIKNGKNDIHEADLGHLEKAALVYQELTELFPDDFTPVECVENGTLLSIEDIHERVWVIAGNLLR
ncbi:MAG: hypothetical protein KGJ13_03710 [Patescibacteria group bacterium]|nr:hypothetical protein [Patescibacteria group bacterium]